MKFIKFIPILITVLFFIILSGFSNGGVEAASTGETCTYSPSSTAGRVTLSVTIPADGTYKTWVRMKSGANGSDSFFLFVDGDCPIKVGDAPFISSSQWTWVDYQEGSGANKINLNLTAGDHTFIVVTDEEGVDLDKMLLTNNLSCVPTGFGDNCPSATVTPVPPGSSNVPIAHWKFDGNASDSSGNGHNGAVVNAATFTQGKIGQALNLDPQGEHVQISGLIGNPQNITVAAWANLTSKDTSGSELISLGDNIGIRLDGGSLGAGINTFYWDGALWQNTITTSPAYLGTGWHHFAYTINTSTNVQTIYVDGVSIASTNHQGNISYSGNGANTFIGKHGNGSTSYDFGGLIDDVRIYNAALSPAEVQALFLSAPSLTNSPTATPTVTKAPTPTTGPTVTSGPATVNFTFNQLKLHGIGTGGDNANPGGQGNNNPLTTTKNITIEFYDGSGTLAKTVSGDVNYSSANGYFQGSINVNDILSGNYIVKVVTHKYLRRQLPGIINITSGETVLLPDASLVVGDINTDGRIGLPDYNILIGCYSDLLPAADCDPTRKFDSDLSDDGSVNQDDYNLFIRETSISTGN